MKLTIGFSPCPNDTFIFDALVNKKIDTGDFEFEAVLEDVETLNKWALDGKLDITKLSFPAFFQSLENYILLSAGSALGNGVGPLLISKPGWSAKGKVEDASVVLPGVNTTANLLFSFAYPKANNKHFTIFSGIENEVLEGKADLGVIIHENRFTYEDKGLEKIVDLGEYWEHKMQTPIPLGGIAISQSVKRSVAKKVTELIQASIEYSYASYPTLSDYVKSHSQEMDTHVMRQHIDLYVNAFTKDLGNEGMEAIETLYEVYQKSNNLEIDDEANLFL